MRHANNKGQAVVEMALFASVILIIFGALLSYIQSQNEQQYVQMEGFRRALEKACNYKAGPGAGASVRFTVMSNRHGADTSGSFRGSSQAYSSSSDVFWAVPKVGTAPKNAVVYRINEDPDEEVSYDDFISKNQQGQGMYLRTERTISDTETSFDETVTKAEDTASITNTRQSTHKETLGTTIPFTIRQKATGAEASEEDVIVSSGQLLDKIQHLYKDTDGQYKYSSVASADSVVNRQRTWETEF